MYIFEGNYVVPVICYSKKEDNFSYIHIESSTQILIVFCSFICEVLSIKVKEIFLLGSSEDEEDVQCVDIASAKKCKKIQEKGKCNKGKWKTKCIATCGFCK